LTKVLERQAINIATSARGSEIELPVSFATEMLTASMSDIPAIALEIRVPWSPKVLLA
jgi:hypothetical protein